LFRKKVAEHRRHDFIRAPVETGNVALGSLQRKSDFKLEKAFNICSVPQIAGLPGVGDMASSTGRFSQATKIFEFVSRVR
jgi:hypothetical protein